MNITNDAQMSVILNDIVHDVAVAVANRLYDLNRAEIEAIVYGAGSPRVYERSPDGKGFVDAWDTKTTKGLNTHTAELNYQPEKMMYDPDNFVHGSGSKMRKTDTDIRTELATIIYEGIGAGSYHKFGYGHYSEPRDAFREVIKRFSQSLDKWIVDEFVKHGFSRKDIEYPKGARAWGVSLDGTD